MILIKIARLYQVLLARLYDSALSSAGHRPTCCQCGFRNEEHEQTIYSDAENNSSDDSSDSDDSDASSTSTNTTIRLSRNYSHHNILRVSELFNFQHRQRVYINELFSPVITNPRSTRAGVSSSALQVTLQSARVKPDTSLANKIFPQQTY